MKDSLTHLDRKAFTFSCPMIVKNVTMKGKYSDIFGDKIDKELTNTLLEINKFREEYLDSRSLDQE